MERTELLKNQPYDEILEVEEEEVQSLYSPSPRGAHTQSSRGRRGGRSLMSAQSSSSSQEEEQEAHRRSQEVRGQPGVSPAQEEEEEEEEEEESDEEDSEEEDEEEEEEGGGGPEGVYDPADYSHLPVNSEIKDLFQYITRFTPQCVELDHSLKPFIPDFIPAVGDIDAFLKVPRPDGKCDGLGLAVLDEPSVKQSDPTVQSLFLTEESKQHSAEEMKKVSSVRPVSNPRAVDSWVDSIWTLHRSKPAASVQYGRAMPDVEALMQEWPAEVEELLGGAELPSARLACSLQTYSGLLCSLLDIPVYCSRLQALHLLFSLYLEFRESQHFTHTHRS